MADFYRLVTFGLFFSFGVSITAWISALPGLKEAFALDDLMLGLLLLTYGITSIIMAYPNSLIVTKFGPKKVSYFSCISGAVIQSVIPLVAGQRARFTNWPISPIYPLCFVNGILGSGFYTSFTVKATQLEQDMGCSCMSSFHAGFSLGAFLGSILYSVLLRYGHLSWHAAYPTHVLIATTVTLTFVTLLPADKPAHVTISDVIDGLSPSGCKPNRPYFPVLSPTGEGAPLSPFPAAEEPSPSLSAYDSTYRRANSPIGRTTRLLSPHPAAGRRADGFDANVLRLAVISGIAMVAEATIGDWGGIYIIRECHGLSAQGPWLYGAFACGMMPLRLFGDSLVDKFGRKKVFRLGGMLAVIGYAALVLFPSLYIALLSAFLIGVGVANNVPIIQTSAAKSELMSIAQVTATLSAFNAAAMLGGPSIIGPVSRGFGLRAALCLPLAGLVGLVYGARYLDVNKR